MDEKDKNQMIIPAKDIEWRIPENFIKRYATNMLVQRGPHEYIISFFELEAPIKFEGKESQTEKPGKFKARANCVASIIVAKDRLPVFLKVLNGVAENPDSTQEDETN